jgi:type IV pilus assembly protein PilA
MKKRGFTLIELLAVILILGIITLIAVPTVTKIVDQAKKEAFKDSAYGIIKSAQFEYTQDVINGTEDNLTFTYTNGIESSSIEGKTLDYKGLRPKSGTVKINGAGEIAIAIHNGKYCVVKEYTTDELTISIKSKEMCVLETEIVEGECNTTKGVNCPELVAGMTPIKWDGANWTETTSTDPEWYSYTPTDKKWANARTDDGSMWVWIPRYIYRISSGWHTQNAGTVDIKFSIGTDDTIDGTVSLVNTGKATDSNGTWTNHPAFTFGSNEVNGIWIAKYEATAREGIGNTTEWSCSGWPDNTTAKHVQIVPNVPSWRCVYIKNMFTVSRNMETDGTYGWGTTGEGIDTHLAKNVEWGATAYLTQSSYGKNAEVWRNNSTIYITGCAGAGIDGPSYSGCENTYQTLNGQQASTTGNVYGIYDMSGGSWEFVSAHIDNNNPTLMTWGSDIINANSKYSDIYPVTVDNDLDNYENTINRKGDAVYETSSSLAGEVSWYGDMAWPNSAENAWFLRSGFWNDSPGDAGLFHFAMNDGDGYSYFGFRPVLIVGDGL